jgi:hypothetical protein
MFPFHLTRSKLAELAAAVLIAVPVPGGIAVAQASEPPPWQAPTPIRRALREFDRFLDHHPLLEGELRLNPALTGDRSYLKKHYELRDFLASNLGVIWGLKHHPRYFLYRALLRQASSPLRYSEIAELGEVLDEQPELERALVQNPAAIRDQAFLQEHALLRDFLLRHPALGFEFLPWDQPAGDNHSHDHSLTPPRNDSQGPRSHQHQ